MQKDQWQTDEEATVVGFIEVGVPLDKDNKPLWVKGPTAAKTEEASARDERFRRQDRGNERA